MRTLPSIIDVFLDVVKPVWGALSLLLG